jgi:exonuclease V gamma subunit
MIYLLATLFPGPVQKGILLSDADQIEEFLSFLQSLEADLAPMRVDACSLGIWAQRFEALASKYLTHDPEDEADVAAWKSFQGRILALRKADARLGEISYPFEVIDPFINRSCSGPFHGSHLHAVRIGSIEPGTILPARALFLIGMDEEAYPRKRIRSSLDLLKNESVYVPEKPDIDRYLFLQILFAARDFLRISYGHLSPDEGKPVGPSLLVQELLNAAPHDLSRVVMKKTRHEPMPLRFSLRCPQKSSLEAERIISLSDLAAFARHPWKHYLQRVEGIYVENRTERTFALQRSPLLRASLKWPLESLLRAAPDLPPTLFKEAFLIDLEERATDWGNKKREWGDSLFSLSFLESAETMRRTKDRTEFPPLEIELDEGSRVLLIGEVNHVMEQGVLHLGDDSLPALLKAWPELLAASIALGTSRIYFLKNGKVKTITDPKKSIKSFISYYLRCTNSLSPLVPDWADSLLRRGFESFDTKTEYEDPVVDWLLPRLEVPSPELLFKEWEWLREVFADLIALYPRRGAYETV